MSKYKTLIIREVVKLETGYDSPVRLELDPSTMLGTGLEN